MMKKFWADISPAPISEEAIRARHLPPGSVKIYVSAHPADTHFRTTAGHAFDLYVLAGSCKFTHDGSEQTLSASQLITLEKGAYEFDVIGNNELKLVKVFSLA